MRPNRRDVTLGLTAAGFGLKGLGLIRPPQAFAQGDGVKRSYGASLIGPLKHAPDIPHLPYVNPEAPKGGRARISSFGGFDSLNPFIAKGDPAAGIGLVFDTLMGPVLDESSSEYALIADWIEFPADYSWVAFGINENARWHDGRPVTVADVIFSFEILTTKGAPLYRLYYGNVTSARDMGDRVVRFDFDETGNRELPQIMGQLVVLPRHWWEAEGRDFAESTLERPMGSGPYRVGAFEANRFLELERVEDYWAADMPFNVGHHNFDRLRYEYFKDDNAALEAFKVGEIDYRAENSARNWATAYDFKALREGTAHREEVELGGPKRVQYLSFNLRRPKFQDRRVREAIGMMFDFEWTNKTIYYSQYARPWSFFLGADDLRAEGVPEGAELAMLEEYRDQLPPALFEEPFKLPESDGSGRIRRRIRSAKKLLEEAGWRVVEGRLVDEAGEPFTLEFLSSQKSQERVLGPFMKNLDALGIEANLRFVDSAQYVRRFQEQDFDMIIYSTLNSMSPGNEQREYWGSAAADQGGSRNVGGVKNPVVDALIEKIIFAKDREELAAATRALDRVLLWEHYVVMQLYTPFTRIAWHDPLTHPEPLPELSIGFPTIWWSSEAEAG